MLHWVVENQLARGRRPGYNNERGTDVPQSVVDAWMEDVKSLGIKSIICLLAEDQLVFYATLPSGLVAYYREAGFSVAHVPACDHQWPSLTDNHLERIWSAYKSLPKPVLVHCSAGVDRTGRAVEYIEERLNRDA